MGFKYLKSRIKRLGKMKEEFFLVRTLDGGICCLTKIPEKEYRKLINNIRIQKPCFKKYKLFRERFFNDESFRLSAQSRIRNKNLSLK